ncbi:sugar phosphate isomerase/epimerase family protein [Dactylosporangium sp. CA-233914]|uniref:sugar phosphate isomerase/epimerase family protein n=1 Tax=Dactylosporangium sp. CA-233914 TaxID=3239934 RepID=UPI003D91CA27
MGNAANIRFGTDIITFFNTAYWGLGEELPYPDWAAAVGRDPRSYFDRMLDGVRDAGLEGVELAPEPGGWTTALKAYGNAAGVKRALSERGLVLASSYAPGRQLIGDALDDPDREAHADTYMAQHAEFLAELGADTITMGNIARSRFGNNSPDDTATAEDFAEPVPREIHERFAEQVNRLGAVVARYGVRIAIHTDAYSVCSRNEDIATVLELTDPKNVMLCPDAGHITLDGGDAVEVLRRHLGRIPTMHWKDCAQPLSGHVLRGDQKERHATMLTHFRILGSGKVDWSEWMRILRDNRWRGWAIEEIDMSPDPVGELRQGLEYFRTALAPIYS